MERSFEQVLRYRKKYELVNLLEFFHDLLGLGQYDNFDLPRFLS